MIYTVTKTQGKESSEMEFNDLSLAEDTFIQSVLEEMNAVYVQFTQLDTTQLIKHSQRIRTLSDSILRFKLKEIKKASFEFRESIFTLSEQRK